MREIDRGRVNFIGTACGRKAFLPRWVRPFCRGLNDDDLEAEPSRLSEVRRPSSWLKYLGDPRNWGSIMEGR